MAVNELGTHTGVVPDTFGEDLDAVRVCVVGLGYIGLPTASLLATKGFKVHGVDLQQTTVETINQGNIHIEEPDLDVLVRSAVQSGRLHAHLKPVPADVFILAVPTPLSKDNRPDVSYVESATRAIAPCLEASSLVILESTSPVGTSEQVCRWLREERPDLPIPPLEPVEEAPDGQVFVAHCPERVLPGQILKELVDNDRIVGGVDGASAEKARDFYRTFVGGRIFTTHSRVAELTKLTENAFRDVNIAFANELSLICEKLNIDVWEVIDLANHHPRVNVLQPGPGVGGHCIPVDPWFIVESAGDDARLLRTAREVNLDKTERVAAQILEASQRLSHPTVACLGLTYKNDVDDLRESPAIEIVARLAREGNGSVLVVDPHVQVLPEGLARLGVRLSNLEPALDRAQIVAGLVRHRQFLDLSTERLTGKTVIDTCCLWCRRPKPGAGGG